MNVVLALLGWYLIGVLGIFLGLFRDWYYGKNIELKDIYFCVVGGTLGIIMFIVSTCYIVDSMSPSYTVVFKGRKDNKGD